LVSWLNYLKKTWYKNSKLSLYETENNLIN